MNLIARRSMTYNTRRLQAGDPFEANDRMGKVLVKLRKAEPAPERQTREPSPPPSVKPELRHLLTDDTAEIEALRLQAERLGVAVDRRWGVKRLQTEIAARA